MKSLRSAVLTGMAILSVFAPAVANAAGALAVGIENDRSESIGWATGDSLSDVKQRAIRNCREASQEDGYPGTACRIVVTFKDQCAAYAWTDEIAGFGWAVAANRAKAGQKALAKCRASHRDSASCAVIESFCD